MIQAVIFDMDGVLVDTEEFICEAAMQYFAERGVQVKAEDFLDFVGMGENRYIGGVAEKYGVPIEIVQAKKRTYEIYDAIVRGRIKPLDGVMDFLARCKRLKLKTAVATSADRTKMDINLREMGLTEADFNACVNGLEVERKKPHPDIFLFAAQKIGAEPAACLVVEDAISGVAAAKAAGMKCLALTTSFTPEQLAGADWIVPTLAHAPQECTAW
ncbi:MAG TPA: HAD-IA family hydrolase [bacterium]|nr:HAD-IA family hydrolase [Candidatus Omnitrophota bacterium]HOJ62272.1 HAD-IA family hydrolase [bacterium]HOL94639.1 HAD-IA family hydrolase [bacterium]HPP02372.1 HAD-IA family hydrolase [bacterium]HXK92416.1 HAD-IA family hydrolase [bacterium]